MASVIYQRPYRHHPDVIGVPSGVYWAAGLILVTMALFVLFSSAAGGPAALFDPNAVPPGLFMPLL